MAMGRSLRRLRAGLYGVVCVCVVLPLAAYGLAQTETGRQWIADRISRLASDDEMTVRLSGLGRNFPWNIHVDSFTAVQGGQPLVTVTGLNMVWKPWSLLTRRIHIETLSAATVETVLIGDTETSGAQVSSPASGPNIFDLPVDIRIDRAQVGRVTLGGDTAVRPEFSLKGAFRLERSTRRIEATVDLQRRDKAGHFRAALKHVGSPARFDLEADLLDGPDGLIGKLAGMPGLPEAKLQIDGDGPADDWRGKASLTLGGAPAFAADLTVSAGPETRIGLKSSLDTAATLPPMAGSLIGPKAALSGVLRIDGQSGVTLETFSAVSDRLNLEASGRYSPESGTIDANGRLRAAAVPPAVLPGGMSAGELDIVLHVSGGVQSPSVEISGSVAGISVPEVARIAKLDLTGTLSAKTDLSLIGFDNMIAVQGIRFLSEAANGQRIESGQLTVAGDIRNFELVSIRAASLSSPILALTASRGEIDLTSGALKLVVDARLPRLEAIALLRPHVRAGAFSVNAEIGGNLNSGRLETVSGGRLTGLEPVAFSLPPELAQIGFSGQVRVGPDGGVEITALQVDSALGRISADVSQSAGSGRLTGQMGGEISRLDALSGMLGMAVGGAARLDAAYAGTMGGDGNGKISLSLDRPVLGPASFDAATATVTGAVQAGKGTGTIEFDLSGNRKSVSLRTPFRSTAETVRLDALRIASDILSGEGDLAIPLGDGRFTGKMALKIPELRDLTAMAGMAGAADFPAAGALTATVESTGRGADLLEFSVDGRSIVWTPGADELKAGRITASGSIAGIAGKPNGKVQAVAENASMADRKIRRITAKADIRSSDSVVFDLSANGLVDPANTIAVSGALEHRSGGTAIRVSTLAGSIGSQKLAIDEPGSIDITPTGTAFKFSAMRIGAGEIGVSGTASDTELSVDATVRAFPLALLNELGLAPVSAGTLDLTAQLRGVPETPDAELKMKIADLRLVPNGAGGLPVIAAEANASVGKGILFAKAAVSAPGAPVLTFSGRVGSEALGIYRFDDRTPVDLRIDGTGALGALMIAVLPDGDQMSGTLEIALSVGGSLSAPDLNGTVDLSDVNYESGTTGMTVKGLEARLAASGRMIEIVRLSGSDGGDGTLSGGGRFDISALDSPDGNARLEFTQFRVARRDDAIVDASGKFGLKSSGDAIEVSGQAKIESADILIPEKLPGAVYELDVEEIRDGKPVRRQLSETAEKTVIPVKLDVTLEMPGQVFVRGRGLQSEWKGRIRATGDAAAPMIDGRLDIVNGSFSFAGKKFDIGEGNVKLPPGTDPDPRIYMAANTEAGDIVAKVTVEGPASLPRITLSSDPPLPREEILSRILFGKSSANLSPVQAAQLAESAATISGVGGSVGIFDRLRRATGLDVLDVESNGDSPTGSTLKAGKYVADGVFVSAGQGLTPGSGKVGVEIEVTPYLSIDTEAGSSADSSVGISLKHDF
tara:strand:- start:18836 stop:23224 length:4389 start_codon:yes stop_codon:yes gene_type:complete